MTEKRESDEFEDEDADDAADGDDPDLEHLIQDLEKQKRRGGPKPGEPAWRRLEKLMEQKRTAELLSDFDDYDIGDDADDGDGSEADVGDADADEDEDEDEDEDAAAAAPARGTRKAAARKKSRR